VGHFSVKQMFLNRRDALVACAVLGFSASQSASASTSAGMVRAVFGDARARQRTQERALTQNADIFVGDRISTGASTRANILLGSSTDLRLGSNAEIRIDRFLVNAGGVINLEAGALMVDKVQSPQSGILSVRSPYGLIAVRGTRFFAGPSNGLFGVFVEQGSVAVTGGGKQVIVSAGEGTDIAKPGDAPSAPRAWGFGRIESALALVY
jgi:hypothetical protein